MHESYLGVEFRIHLSRVHLLDLALGQFNPHFDLVWKKVNLTLRGINFFSDLYVHVYTQMPRYFTQMVTQMDTVSLIGWMLWS